MRKKLIILVCAVMVAGAYAVYQVVENSILIQNVLAFQSTEDGEEVGDGEGGNITCWSAGDYGSGGFFTKCSTCTDVDGKPTGGEGKCRS